LIDKRIRENKKLSQEISEVIRNKLQERIVEKKRKE